MAIPTITMSCNSLPLTAIETAANNCELDTTTKKFGSGSIKILQGGYIDVAMPSVFNMLTDSWTVEHWFSITDLETDNYHHLINADNDANGQWAVYVDNTGKLTLNRRGGAANTSTVAVANNEWHHLRVTHTGNKTLKAYLDGNLFATNTFSAAPDSMRIGKSLGESTRWYTGNIDEIAFTILDASNVAEYSGDTAPVPTEGYPDEICPGSGGTSEQATNILIQLDAARDTLVAAINAKGGSLSQDSTLYQCANAIGGIESGGTDTTDATAIASDILQDKTAYAKDEKITGTIPTVTASMSDNVVTVPKGYVKSAQTLTVGTALNAFTITPAANAQVISKGSYLKGEVTVAGDTNLTAANIKSGVTIFNVAGTYEGESTGGTSAEYYKCASVDVSAKTWSGYKAVFDSGTGTWSFESDVTEGLAYTGLTPVVNKIYTADTTIQLAYIKLAGILNDETVKFLLYPKSSGTLEDISAGGNGVTVVNTGGIAIENGRIVFGEGKALTIPANTLPNDIFVSGSPFIIEFQGIIPAYTSKTCASFARKEGSMYYNRLDMYLNTIEGDPNYGQMTIGYWTNNVSVPAGAFTVGAEHVVAFEYDGSDTSRVYLDGVLQYSFTGTSYLPFRTYDFLIGHDTDEIGGSNGNPFQGNMSYFRIRNVAPYQGASYTPEFV